MYPKLCICFQYYTSDKYGINYPLIKSLKQLNFSLLNRFILIRVNFSLSLLFIIFIGFIDKMFNFKITYRTPRKILSQLKKYKFFI